MSKEHSVPFFEERIKEEFLLKRKRSIETNQQHNECVCLVANSFYGPKNSLTQQTGFKTISLEPLFDIKKYLDGEQSKNFDIMLHNSVTKHTIFIEVKTGFQSIKKMLDDFKEAQENALKYFDEKLSNKINISLSEHSFVDFVLLLPREQSLPVKERIAKENIENIIIWDLSTITKPPIGITHDVLNVEEMVKKKQTHSNETVRKQLNGGLKLKQPIKIFNFMLNSDPHQKLTYFSPLLRAQELDKFNYTEVKNRILDGEMSFSAYTNPEEAKEFIYNEIIKHLDKIDLLIVTKQTEDILKNEYELKADKRVNETILRNKISKTFFDYYLEENYLKIKQEALDRYNHYHGQNTLG